MKTTKTGTYTALITIGLQKYYCNQFYTKNNYIEVLQNYQKKLIKEKSIYLSASVSDCLIVLNKQEEPHLKLEFINYPKFPLKEDVFKIEVNQLAQYLMKQFNQNRIVIVYHNETLMFEIDESVDFRINQ
tara:strand:+ start:960 stop:1349 length:390 start_codon:yes stop_codon:yes gene_type:complete